MAIALLIALVLPSITHLDFQDITMFSVPLTVLVWVMPLFLSALMDRQEFIGNTMQILFILFVCGQFTFLFNLFIVVLKKISNQYQ